MMSVPLRHLHALYEHSDDPWNFRNSAYEQAKFIATKNAIARNKYRAIFELGCGNGELARHIVPRCNSYTGMDAVPAALAVARNTVPMGQFIQGFYPCELPDGAYDLIILSEVLYFLDEQNITKLAKDIARYWPDADVICVSWLGATGNELQGAEALFAFCTALRSHEFACIQREKGYRIDHGRAAGKP